MFINPADPLAKSLTTAIQTGDTPTLTTLLKDHPDLPTAYIGTPSSEARSLLHILTDYPGNFPAATETAKILITAGADVNARFAGGEATTTTHSETPLHWAASCDDVAVLDALLDAGADINAKGGVIGGDEDEDGGTPLADARAFGQVRAAMRLVERGADVSLMDAATLGLLGRVKGFYQAEGGEGDGDADGEVLSDFDSEDTDFALWGACQGGWIEVVEYLVEEKGARVDVVPPWEELTPLDVARREGHENVVEWLVGKGAKGVKEL